MSSEYLNPDDWHITQRAAKNAGWLGLTGEEVIALLTDPDDVETYRDAEFFYRDGLAAQVQRNLAGLRIVTGIALEVEVQ